MLHPSGLERVQTREQCVRDAVEVVVCSGPVRGLELLKVHNADFGMLRELVDVERNEVAERFDYISASGQ